jgi:hypothetical protein
VVFPDIHPDHKFCGEAKGIEHVLRERCLWPEKNRRSDGHKFILQCPSRGGQLGCDKTIAGGCYFSHPEV